MTLVPEQRRGILFLGQLLQERLAGSLVFQNIAWNYAGLIFLNGLSVVSISLYIRILGAHEWGLIAACVSLQVIFNILDMGFSQISPKWFVDDAAIDGEAVDYFGFFRTIYLLLAVVGFLVIQLAAHRLSADWFKVPVEDQTILETSVRLISFQFVFQFLNSLNNSVWNGQQRQKLANVRACIFMSLRHLIAVSLLYFVLPDARIYCASFMVISMIEWGTNYRTVRKNFHRSSEPVDPTIMRRIAREVAVLIIGVLVGTAVTQIDRITLSRSLPLQQFGTYTLVLTLALALLQLQMPVTRSFFPRMVRDIQNDGRVTSRTWRGIYGFTTLFVGGAAVLLAVAAHPLLMIWTGNASIAAVGTPALRVLCAGVFLNAMYGCLYQYFLASGRNDLVLKFNLVSLIGVGILVWCWRYPLSPQFGGAIWVTIGTLQVCCGGIWYYRHKTRIARSEKEKPC